MYRDGDRWRGSVEVGRGVDGRRRRKKVSGRTKTEVLAKIREIHRTMGEGLPTPDERLTLGTFLDRWLAENVPGTISDSTLDNYADTARLHLKPALGHTVLTRLTVRDVDELLAAKREAGYSANTVRLIRTVLRRALTAVERDGLVPRNVASLSTPPRVRRAPGRSLTVEQAHLFLTTVRGHRLELLFALMLTFGLRRGEALGLAWDGVDWTQGTVQVVNGVKRVKNLGTHDDRATRIVVGELTTRRSRRTLYLTPALLGMAREHRARQALERATLGEAWTETGLMFTTELGTVLDPDNVSHLFSRLCRQAGLGHWHAHELRHSGASLMLAHGTPLHVVSEVLGHASIAITKDVYGHLVEGEKRTAAQAIGAALFPDSGADQP